MGALTAGEIEMMNMHSTWEALHAVEAWQGAMTEYILNGLQGFSWGMEGLSEGNRLAAEFRASWPHPVPGKHVLVLADRAGVLKEKIAELNADFDARLV